ncbi:sodium- and chloride-dependent glycine transporter 2, partial [Caerostris extrusa]
VPPKVTDKNLQKEWVSETKIDYTVREKWGSKAEFLLSCIGLAVGIGNVWRFPYLAYQNGGGAFLVAYIVLLLLVGKPHFFAESWVCYGSSVSHDWNLLQCGHDVHTYYIGQSFRFELPWKHCESWWGADENCYVRRTNETPCGEVNERLANKYTHEYSIAAVTNVTNLTWNDKVFIVPLEEFTHAFNTCNNATQTASEQFWERYVLQLTSGIDELGIVKWDLALTLFICWMIVFLGIMKGIKSSGKVVYFTATFPYVILIILVIYGCTLSGAMTGLKYLFIPEWKKLLEIQVWRAAAEQLLFSLSLGSGCLIMNASYNKFENKLYRDAMFMKMGIDISKVAKGGQGLAFVTYPEALARLPVSQLWSVLFFFMLFLLAVDSEFSVMENVFTCLYDEYPHLKKRKVLITFFSCLGFFLLGLPCVLQRRKEKFRFGLLMRSKTEFLRGNLVFKSIGGQYILNLMDTYGGGVASLFIATIEIIALMWVTEQTSFVSDMDFMLGFKPGLYWRLCWKYISPLVLWTQKHDVYFHLSENSSEEANSNGGIVNLGMDPVINNAR